MNSWNGSSIMVLSGFQRLLILVVSVKLVMVILQKVQKNGNTIYSINKDIENFKSYLKTMYIVNLIRKILDMLILLKTTKQQRNFTFLDSLDLQAHCAFPGLGTACHMICVNPQYPRIPYKA